MPLAWRAPPSASKSYDETIQTTTNHPWLSADHGWILASFLRLGEPVQRVDGSIAVQVAISTGARLRCGPRIRGARGCEQTCTASDNRRQRKRAPYGIIARTYVPSRRYKPWTPGRRVCGCDHAPQPRAERGRPLMTASRVVRPKTGPGGIYYGWLLVTALALAEMTSWGVLYYAFTVFLEPMHRELGWSNASMAGASRWRYCSPAWLGCRWAAGSTGLDLGS